MRGIEDIRKSKIGDEHVVLVLCQGLDDAEGRWEPVLSRMFEDPPIVLQREFRKIRLFCFIS